MEKRLPAGSRKASFFQPIDLPGSRCRRLPSARSMRRELAVQTN